MPPAAAIRAVTFDVGGTLIDPWPSVGHVYAGVAARLGHPMPDPARLNRQFAEAWQGRRDFDYSLQAWKGVVVDTFEGVLSRAEAEALFGELYGYFALADPWRVFPDVVPALEALRAAGLRLGLISNWDERLRPLLERLRLSRYFDVLVISHEFGSTKPDPELFRAAARLLGTSRDLVFHIGDGERDDYRGALEAGLQAGWLRRGGGAERRRGEYRTLTELREALGKE